METIEERAFRRALKMLNPNSGARPTTRELLIEMATEQRKIDIDKAWKWVEAACSKRPITADELPILRQSFKRTMEE